MEQRPVSDLKYDPAKAEEILCGHLLNREAIAADLPLVSDDFGDSRCRMVFEACQKLEAEKLEVSLVSVNELLPDLMDFLLDLLQARETAFGSNASQLAEIIHRNAQRRRLTTLADKIKAEAGNGGDPETIAGAAWDGLAAAIGESRKAETRNLSIVCSEVLDSRNHPDQKPLTVPSGIAPLDRCLNGGFRAGNLAIVGARPSSGKSAFLLSVVANASATGHRVLYVSLEMTAEENAERFLALSSGLPVSWFAQDIPLSEQHMEQIAEGQTRYDPALIEQYDRAVCRVSDIRRLARRMQATGGLHLIGVDYLGLLTPETRSASRTRNDEVSELSRGLKALAMEFSVPVIAAHQLNRAGKDAPRLEHLRDSGAVEQDANAVLLLHNPDESSAARERNPLDLLLAKNRQGRTGKIRLFMNPALMRFETEGFTETREQSPFDQ